ncbi:hypothetical protein [Hyphomicrobium sp. CS1BSMeth3]|uniref:hypothetical protein n=1 Tax=Hyphomicrobium sp. CS1BSMeth3 TaxID=1892844 RepID=UPI0009307BD5|nr:hypothetical protein [Hyphomicrobium sp. CS1BSMeth3]
MPHLRDEAESLLKMLRRAIETAKADIAAIPADTHPLLRQFDVLAATREATGIAETVLARADQYGTRIGREAVQLARMWLDGDLLPREVRA